MMTEEILIFIKELGFPIFVCLWFMLRTERIIKNNTKALNRNSTVIEKRVPYKTLS